MEVNYLHYVRFHLDIVENCKKRHRLTRWNLSTNERICTFCVCVRVAPSENGSSRVVLPDAVREQRHRVFYIYKLVDDSRKAMGKCIRRAETKCSSIPKFVIKLRV